MEKPNWAEDPETEMECVKCKTTWKLGENIGCPKCDGPDGGLEMKEDPTGELQENFSN